MYVDPLCMYTPYVDPLCMYTPYVDPLYMYTPYVYLRTCPEAYSGVSGIAVRVSALLSREFKHAIAPRHHAIVDANPSREDEELTPPTWDGPHC